MSKKKQTHSKKEEGFVKYCSHCDHRFDSHFLTVDFNSWCERCNERCPKEPEKKRTIWHESKDLPGVKFSLSLRKMEEGEEFT